MDMDKIIQRLVTTAVSIAGGWVATQVVQIGWKTFTGEDAPNDVNGDDDETPMVKLVIFAVLSAGISALIQTASQRGVKKALAAGSKRKNSGSGRRRLGSAEV